MEVPIGFKPTITELKSGLEDIRFEMITVVHSVGCHLIYEGFKPLNLFDRHVYLWFNY